MVLGHTVTPVLTPETASPVRKTRHMIASTDTIAENIDESLFGRSLYLFFFNLATTGFNPYDTAKMHKK